MARQRFRTAVSCRDPRRCSCLLINTFQDTRLPCRAPVCLVRASPKTARFDRTTSRAPSFLLAGLITDNQGMLRLEIAARVRQSFFHGEPEWDEDRQMICNLGRGSILL